MEISNSHYFYVVKCKDGTLYGGYTNHLEKRIQTHNAGKGAKYTRGRRPVELIYSKSYPTKTAAMQAEYAFKQLPRKKKIAYLEEEGTLID
ncbi:putative endonuclease [Bacillus ectoiniformans]|uniref:GIY-YIG nuclease family protein n=1 Tax=Bacillus ectoiniformans TaxID=1494429 RepID=UPI00195E13AA|nr:GIY-YIG nuclease family protein [Bacillus ectoiniformans]MBM7650319.1 putative endonuclease [Bacillus ectoiniformans]